MKQYKNFRSVITSQIWVQETTSRHNTLCSQPDCYSNCHVQCNLGFSLNAATFLQCAAMGGGTKCLQCNHSYDTHRHYNSLWKLKDHSQDKVDRDAEAKYKKAKREKNNHETTIVDLVEKSLDNMKEKLKVVKAANEKVKGSIGMPKVVEAANEKTKGNVYQKHIIED